MFTKFLSLFSIAQLIVCATVFARAEPRLDSTRRPGADEGANVGATVNNPSLSGDPNAQSTQPAPEPDKITSEDERDILEEVQPPEPYREVPRTEAEAEDEAARARKEGRESQQ